MDEVGNFKIKIFEYLCKKCNCKNKCKNCKLDGDYKSVNYLIDNFVERMTKELEDKFEYDEWERRMGEDL